MGGYGALQHGVHQTGACMVHWYGAALVWCVRLGKEQLQFVTIDFGIQGTIALRAGQTYMQHDYGMAE